MDVAGLEPALSLALASNAGARIMPALSSALDKQHHFEPADQLLPPKAARYIVPI